MIGLALFKASPTSYGDTYGNTLGTLEGKSLHCRRGDFTGL